MENVPKRTCKQKHQDRHREFIGEKVQNTLDRILEMRFDPTFDTNLTTSDTSNYEYVNKEWERYQIHLQTKATLLASIEAFSTIEHKITTVRTGETIPPANMIFEVMPTSSDFHPSFVSFMHTHNHGLINRVFTYPDQSSFEQQNPPIELSVSHREVSEDRANPETVWCTDGDETQIDFNVDENHVNLASSNYSDGSGEPEVVGESNRNEDLAVTTEDARKVFEILILNGYVGCATAANLSAALKIPLVAPKCKRKRHRNTRVQVHTLVDARLPQDVIDLENAKKPRALYRIGAYYHACNAINTPISYEWDILKYCVCSIMSFADLCRAFENEKFSRWYHQYYNTLRAGLKRYA